MDPLGLALVWLGLAVCGLCEIIVFSNESAWFGLVWPCVPNVSPLFFSDESAWFGRARIL